ADFVSILEKLWWKLDRALTPEGVRTSAMVCLVDAIRHGTTTLFDHHASPGCTDGSLDIIADAVKRCGVRACLCYEVSDRNGPDETDAGIRENIRFLERCRRQPDPFLAGSFGLHASLTLSDRTLKRCREAAEGYGCGFHVHAAEDAADQVHSKNTCGMRVIERFHTHGLLGGRSILAHCVHVDEKEMQLIRDSGAFVTHQPRSNMNNAVGTAPVDALLARNIPVCMGNDGFSNNMWAEWKAAYLVHKLIHRDPRKIQGFDVITMAVDNTRKLAGAFWPEQTIGRLVPGAAADLILVDYHPFTSITSGNYPWHILFGFETDMVHSTMVAGQWLMRDRRLTFLDEATIFEEAAEIAGVIWDRFKEVSRHS
ncbi:MAG TPA: amidohydrolase family protein, partial [bacterium]|nr:amidohydrolase family protein [bacterium]